MIQALGGGGGGGLLQVIYQSWSRAQQNGYGWQQDGYLTANTYIKRIDDAGNSCCISLKTRIAETRLGGRELATQANRFAWEKSPEKNATQAKKRVNKWNKSH